MRDDKEKREASLYFKKGMLDENPTYLFTKTLKLFKEGNEEEALRHVEIIKDNLDFLVDKALRSGISGLNITRPSIANIVIKLVLKMDCKECFFRILSKTYSTVEISLAVMRNIKNEKLVSWLKEYLKSHKAEGIHILKDMGKEELSLFFDEIFKIAKEEVETPQYVALEILSSFSDKKEVLELFKTFATDWDKNVRKISIMNLVKHSDREDIREVLEDSLEDEREESIKFIIKSALKNKEGKNE